MTPFVEILRPGLHTTIQDLGRPGYRQFGIPTGGALDWLSHCNANQALDNSPLAPTLEIIGPGLSMKFKGYGKISVFGAEVELRLNGIEQAVNEVLYVGSGDVLEFGNQQLGLINYLAIEGSWEGDQKFGSYATLTRTKWGGYQGRILKKGDLLSKSDVEGDQNLPTQYEVPLTKNEIRFLAGPESNTEVLKRMQKETWCKSQLGDRIGHRIETSTPLVLDQHDIQSSPISAGTIQVPANGQPIVLLNDSASTGGYARVGNIIAADLPSFCQLQPGSTFKLKHVSTREALQALKSFREPFSLLLRSPIPR